MGMLFSVRKTCTAAVGSALLLLAVVACGDENGDANADTYAGEIVPGGLDGVETATFPAGRHVGATQRVAYDTVPPFGGAHDRVWATCTGIVYPEAVRTENMVHSLEHGAVWIAYNPDELPDAARASLTEKVEGQPYTMMSPYPGIDSPISLQAWGARLKLDDADDPRIDEFITEYRMGSGAPEPGASCSAVPQLFDPDNPPPFDPSPPPDDAVPMR